LLLSFVGPELSRQGDREQVSDFTIDGEFYRLILPTSPHLDIDTEIECDRVVTLAQVCSRLKALMRVQNVDALLSAHRAAEVRLRVSASTHDSFDF
tara:strand:- start:1870 stop:2157 length:288 start_codon:yes stop_codon:yes gene_type:complete